MYLVYDSENSAVTDDLETACRFWLQLYELGLDVKLIRTERG